jgi:beta-mannosidase
MVDQSNWLQTEGYRAAFEETRRQWPHCSAALNWCFNEPWYTVGNNSLVLYPDAPKPAYYSVQSALRPVLFSARVTKFSWEEGEKFKAEIWLLNDSNEIVSSSAKIYFKLGDKIIPLLNSVSGECAPKTNQECASVTCVLPYDESANEISLVIEAGEHSNEYRLQYKRKIVEIKEKILNT